LNFFVKSLVLKQKLNLKYMIEESAEAMGVSSKIDFTASNDTITKEHFHYGHVGVIALCAVVLMFLTFMKSGFKLPQKAQPVKQYTYEQAKAEALAEVTGSTNPVIPEEDQSQFAMLDPNSHQGAVLGASVGTEDPILPDMEIELTDEVLSQIGINIINETTPQLVAQYKENFSLIEMQGNADLILLELGSEDKEVLKEAPEQIQNLIIDLVQMEVPSELAKYHRVNLLYYAALKSLAEGYLEIPDAPDPKETGMRVLSIKDFADRIKNDIFNKFGIEI
jgi:hypothetical protein